MLERDAWNLETFQRLEEMIEALKTPGYVEVDEIPPRITGTRVYVGPEVVDELIRRGEKADRFASDLYALALTRAQCED